MYIIQNALRNLIRNRGRNILMGVIILAIIATTVISLIINNTARGIIDDYKNRFGSEVSISPDIEKLMAQGQNGIRMSQIPPDMYLSFGESDYLKSVKYSFTVPAISDTVHPIDEEEAGKQFGGGNGNLMIRSAGVNSDSVMPVMKIIGDSSLENLTEFSEGQRKIIDGKIYEADSECVISKDLADENSLKVGDSITIKNASAPGEGIYKLMITGIYQDATSEYGNLPIKNPFMNRRNEILTTLATVMGPSYKENSGISASANFILKDPKDLAMFEREVREKGLSDIFKVSTDEASYNKIVAPVEGLKGLTMTFMIVVLILGAIILMLLSSIAMRERKYEVGVLRAMGMKKGKVAMGLLSEMMVITVVCLALGLGVGVAAAQPVSNVLLQNQVKAAEAKDSVQGNRGLFLVAGGRNLTAGTNAKALSEMDVGLGLNTIWQISLISLLLALAASLVSINYITKYEPIEILSDRT